MKKEQEEEKRLENFFAKKGANQKEGDELILDHKILN